MSIWITGRPDSEPLIYLAANAFLSARPFDERPPEATQ